MFRLLTGSRQMPRNLGSQEVVPFFFLRIYTIIDARAPPILDKYGADDIER